MTGDTTYRHYSLFAIAENAVREAEAECTKAFWQWRETRSTEDLTRFNQINKIWQDAINYREQVKGMKKLMSGTVQS